MKFACGTYTSPSGKKFWGLLQEQEFDTIPNATGCDSF